MAAKLHQMFFSKTPGSPRPAPLQAKAHPKDWTDKISTGKPTHAAPGKIFQNNNQSWDACSKGHDRAKDDRAMKGKKAQAVLGAKFSPRGRKVGTPDWLSPKPPGSPPPVPELPYPPEKGANARPAGSRWPEG